MNKMINDCSKKSYPIFAYGKVESCAQITESVLTSNIYRLKINLEQNSCGAILAGQFFMLAKSESNVFLSRPISVFSVKTFSKNNNAIFTQIEFIILLKGQGTKELCSLKNGEQIKILGPLGNGFPSPNDIDASSKKIALIAGGVGVAPIAAFASTLTEKTYDFYASFKSGYFGLENINAEKLVISTEDGSFGTKGMLNAIFSENEIKARKYDIIYACGPIPMLKYIQKLCRATHTKCFFSMENKMACGVGACLGCTIETTDGKKRCCKDGPVFTGETLIFSDLPEKYNIKNDTAKNEEISPDLSVKIAGVDFQNPVIAASGTFGFATEYASIFDVQSLGGICSKGLTMEAKQGNSGTRLGETSSGLMNSIGLENPGIEVFINEKLPTMKALGKPVVIANLGGNSEENYVKGAKLLDKSIVDMIELNISCPNVKQGCMSFGLDLKNAASVTKAVRNATTKPLIVKLSPNANNITSIALSVIESGADAISLCNTFNAMAIDIEKAQFVFDNKTAGLSGPCIKPLALKIVYDVCCAIKTLPKEKQIPVIGIGGIATWQDAIEFIMAGCSAIEVGSAIFQNPNCLIEIICGIKKWMQKKGYSHIEDFRGEILDKNKM